METGENTTSHSLGEKRVRTTFNPSASDAVSQIKNNTAHMIDLLQAMKNEGAVQDKPGETEESLKERIGEKMRLIALAQTAYEEAAMWAVKAATC